MAFFDSLLPAIQHFHILGYWLALFVALFETTIGVGLLLPGSTIILLMGALAGKGYFDLGDLLWFAIIGAVIGDNINYFIGKKYGSKIFAKGFWFIKPAHFKKGETFFEEHGSKSVLVGRFIPSIKEIIPLIAGMFGMKRLSFMIWNILGAIGWGLVWILPGYFFAQSLDLAKMWLTRAGFFLTILLAVFIFLYVLKVIFIKKGKIFSAFFASIWRSIKQAILNNNDIQKLVKRHASFFKFIKERLDRSKFWGLPATLLFIGFIYTIFLFIGVIEDIVTSDLIVFIDIRIANLLAIFRNVEITKFFLWVTLLGKWQIVIGFTVAMIGVLWGWGKRLYIVPLIIAILGSEIFTALGKIVFHRARPELAVYMEHSFSFPSGHATIAVAFYGFLAYILIRNFEQWKTKVNIFFIWLIITLFIGFSRLYLGVHYVSDVWGGYLVGILWLIISISISEWLYSKNEKKVISLPQAKMRVLSLILILFSSIFYVLFALNYHPQISQPAILLQQKEVVQNIDNIFLDKKLKYTETLLGEKQEPLSFIIFAGDDEGLIQTFTKADWFLADKIDIYSIVKLIKTTFAKKVYYQAPMAPSFWNKQPHNFGFEKITVSEGVRRRHQARFWKTKYITKAGKRIYVGTANLDSEIKWGVVPTINPNLDAEQKFIFDNLKDSKVLSSFKKQKFVNPDVGQNFLGNQFFTDGEIFIFNSKQ